MAIRDDTGERTFKPTRRRLAEARKRGLVPRSRELTAAVLTVGALAGLSMVGPSVLSSLTEMFRETLAFEAEPVRQVADGAMRSGAGAIGDVAALLAGLGVLAVAVSLVQGPVFAVDRICPDLSRLIKIGQRGAAARGAFGAMMTVAKLAAVAAIGWWTLRGSTDEIVSSSALEPQSLATVTGSLTLRLAWRLGGAMLALGGVDWLFQRWRFRRDQRMTRREWLDEQKQNARRPRQGDHGPAVEAVGLERTEPNGSDA